VAVYGLKSPLYSERRSLAESGFSLLDAASETYAVGVFSYLAARTTLRGSLDALVARPLDVEGILRVAGGRVGLRTMAYWLVFKGTMPILCVGTQLGAPALMMLPTFGWLAVPFTMLAGWLLLPLAPFFGVGYVVGAFAGRRIGRRAIDSIRSAMLTPVVDGRSLVSRAYYAHRLDRLAADRPWLFRGMALFSAGAVRFPFEQSLYIDFGNGGNGGGGGDDANFVWRYERHRSYGNNARPFQDAQGPFGPEHGDGVLKGGGASREDGDDESGEQDGEGDCPGDDAAGGGQGNRVYDL